MLELILFFLAGVFISWLDLLPLRLRNLTGLLTNITIFVMIFSIGTRVGGDQNLFHQLASLGGKALILAVSCIFGSIIFVRPLERFWVQYSTAYDARQNKEVKSADYQQPVEKESIKALKGPLLFMLLLLSSMGAGIISGHWLVSVEYQSLLDQTATWSLNILLLLIGLDIGGNSESWGHVRKMGWLVLLVPIFSGAGTLFGAGAAGLLLGLPINESLSVGGAFGWYSLSGVMLAKIYHVETGALAFLANLGREIITIMMLPWISRIGGALTCVASGGATTMDTTLPIIAKVTDQNTVVVALVNGMVLSSLVPVLLPILIRI